jgi:hypothetical protein
MRIKLPIYIVSCKPFVSNIVHVIAPRRILEPIFSRSVREVPVVKENVSVDGGIGKMIS